jgi:catechol 2,3-dioxygenase-like lactoylglutathione lyase family enzyme
MPTSLKIDHIVIMVDDLATASQDYTELGFTVLPGGSHADNPSHNALVVFQDGVYLEIIALQPGNTSPRSDRLQKWVEGGPGLVDMALLPQDIEADIAAARARGVPIEDARPGGRLRPDGQQVAWKTANLGGAGLPFFCADVTPRSLRVPEGAVRQHQNGVTGVADLVIAVADLARSGSLYGALLDLEPQTDQVPVPGAKTVSFSLGSATLTLAQPEGGDSPLQPYLASAGDRPYRLTLRTQQPVGRLELDLKRTNGAHLELVGN